MSPKPQERARERGGTSRGAASSPITDQDIYLFNEGTHYRLAEKFGAHPATLDGQQGTHFAVWAPTAKSVSVIGTFNGWNAKAHPMKPRGSSGIWETFVPGAKAGELYKYRLESRVKGYKVDKADPLALRAETPPNRASMIWDIGYEWGDGEWMAERAAGRVNSLDAPMSIYELHVGSWRRRDSRGERSLTYRELADELPAYLSDLGFTHVEFLPVMEHPYYPSWGYQTTGYFAPTSRYGTPQDLMFLIDRLHQAGIGVLLDWVPSHFPCDEHGPGFFDGTHLYEHADPRLGFHPDWNSFIYNYARREVRCFLISSAFHWLERYHADGIRVDAVASMLYLDYSRKDGEWIPNKYGGRENIEAIEFLRQLNSAAYEAFPGIQMIAEESTAWPMVSKPPYVGGLGFGMKWDMGWMHDTLEYMKLDPVHRKFNHNKITFRQIYATSENFVLPLSHDEVVHGKGSLLAKMSGDLWQKFANLRALYGYMYAQPGKKLLFMGSEIGPWQEWSHERELPWHLLQHDLHAGLQRWVRDLNALYREEPALHATDFDPRGFAWVDCSDYEQSVLAFLRRKLPPVVAIDPSAEVTEIPEGFEGGVEAAEAGAAGEDAVDDGAAAVTAAADSPAPSPTLLVLCNFTPVPRSDYRLGVPYGGRWREVLNGDAEEYGGSGQGNMGGVDAEEIACHGHPWSVSVMLPPLAVVFLRHDPRGPSEGDAEPLSS